MKKQFITVILLCWINVSFAGLCHGKFIDPIGDVCWSCLFPMSIGPMEVFSGDHPDTDNPSSPVCICYKGVVPQVGITTGYWEPIALVDATRLPFCLVNLDGISLDMGDENDFGTGETDATDPAQGGSFYYAHWYIYPLVYWLNIITDAICVEKADFDIAYLTEIDPTWNDDELAFVINPEAILFGNVASQLACAADSLAASTGMPIDSLFWCAGAQGSMYPMDGFVQEHVGGVQASTLITERMTYKMHREGLLWDSVGEDSPAICEQYPSAIIPKSRYRYQMTNPIPSSSEPNGCKPFGNTTSIWGSGREYPYSGEDFGYLIWRKRNCCSF